MDTEFWHNRWASGATGWHSDEINVHLQAHWAKLGAESSAKVFVPLCGKSRDMLWLAGQGHRVLGVELSSIAVQAFFEENRLSPDVLDEPPFARYRLGEIEILCGDFFDLTTEHLDGVSAVYDRASLIALPPQTRVRYVQHLMSILPGGVRSLLITLDYPQEQMEGPPFSVTEDEVRALFGKTLGVEKLAAMDILGEALHFRERGLTRLEEHVYRLDTDIAS